MKRFVQVLSLLVLAGVPFSVHIYAGALVT